MRFSKRVIELRTKERNLVKLRNYEEAEKVKAQVDSLEDSEKKQKAQEVY